MSKLFLLTIAVALLIVAAGGIYAYLQYRRETRRAQMGRDETDIDLRQHRRLVM